MKEFALTSHLRYLGDKKNSDVFVPFHPVEMEVKRSFPMHKNGNGTGRGRRDGKCSQKNGDASVPFRPVQTPLHHSCQPFHFHSVCTRVIILGVIFRKKEGQLVDSPTRIDSFILLWSSKLFWDSSLLPLFDFERVLRSRLD